jgi:hypothetical protein
VDYISRALAGSVQNDNLPLPRDGEPWLDSPLPETDHFLANGFANGWVIDPEAIPGAVQNSQGGYDLEIVLEYNLRRLSKSAMNISQWASIVFIAVLFALLVRGRMKRNS